VSLIGDEVLHAPRIGRLVDPQIVSSRLQLGGNAAKKMRMAHLDRRNRSDLGALRR
jgi:hypothetical protein